MVALRRQKATLPAMAATKDMGGIDPENDQEIADRYTDENGEEPAANVHQLHPNRNVNKGEDTNKPN